METSRTSQPASNEDLGKLFERMARAADGRRRYVLIVAWVTALISFGLQGAGLWIIWNHDHALAAGVFLLLWGHGIMLVWSGGRRRI